MSQSENHHEMSFVARLLSPEGIKALALATQFVDQQPLAAASALRAQGFDASLSSTALTQAVLRRKASTKFGDNAQRMFFTRSGLEQATRGVVSTRRAARLAASGVRKIVDLGCGIGADTLAFAAAGLNVTAVDIDQDTGLIAQTNTKALGLNTNVTVLIADATTFPLDTGDAVFCDPARRTHRGKRVFDPSLYSPSWDFVADLPRKVPQTVLKLAPGIDHRLLPPASETEWVSVNGDVVEATCWCGPLAVTRHRATVIGNDGIAHEITGSGIDRGSLAPLRRYLYDPNGAVVRAHLVAEFAETIAGTLADQRIAYVYADQAIPTPFGRCYEITDVLPTALKRLRSVLRERRIGNLTILKRGSALEVERLRHQLRLSGDNQAVLVLTRVLDAPVALLCRPATGLTTSSPINRGEIPM